MLTIAADVTTNQPISDYALGYTDAEQERLIRAYLKVPCWRRLADCVRLWPQSPAIPHLRATAVIKAILQGKPIWDCSTGTGKACRRTTARRLSLIKKPASKVMPSRKSI